MSTDPDGVFPSEPCSGHVAIPGASTSPASWSPAFGAWLCGECRGSRTRAELGATEQANADAANEAARRRAAGGAA